MTLSSENVFEILSEAISEGVIVVDQTQKIVATNSAAEEMFGYATNELYEQSLHVLIPKPYHTKHEGHVKQFLSNQSKRFMGQGKDLFGQRKNGETFPVEVGLNPFTIYGNRYVMALVMDITDRKNYLERLEKTVEERTEQLTTALHKEKELNELKTKFLSLVSHEFKTPLSGILTSASLIGKYKTTEQQEKREKHLTTIRNKVKYLDTILNDFLSVERLESGKVTYKFKTFPLSKVINEVVSNANMLLKEGQRIAYPKNIEEYVIEYDEKILELVLSNLIHNAIKYSPENTIIILDAYVQNDVLTCNVKDEGIGIPEKEQKFIFKRYFRAENAVLNQGTGIGLNIAKTHLENLGGTLSFTSIEGKGTTFTIHQPITNHIT